MDNKLKKLEELEASFRKRLFRQRLQIFSGNVSAACRSLGVSRDTFYRVLK
ncbi:MAG: helix-turn-helix domain-containing protein [Pirellulales bacterium]